MSSGHSYINNSTNNISNKNKVLVIFIAAFVIRIIGVDYGYFNPDERVNDSAKVLAGELIPGQHFYPPLLNYITAVFFAMLYVVGRLAVSWYDLAEFRAQYFSDPTPFYLTARFVICLISAAVAPLFYLIAREFGLNNRYSLVSGLFGIFIPGMVFLSHIFKSDVPLSVCVVLVFYAAIKKLKTSDSKLIDIFLGFSIALALSFKHSYIFILLPFSLMFAVVVYKKTNDVLLLMRSLFFVGIPAIVFWIVFNVGIILDFNNFIDYQRIQTVMSVREDKNIAAGFLSWWSIVGDYSFGVNRVVVILFLLSPVVLLNEVFSKELKGLFLSFWLSIVIGSLAIMYLSGARQLSGLWVPYMVPMQLMTALLLCSVMQKEKKVFSIVVVPLTLIAFFASIYGTFGVMQQALARPIVHDVESFIETHYQTKDTKILTSFSLDAPQTRSMREASIARDERIADKYSIELPQRAPESLVLKDYPNAINYFDMPVAFYGLENASDEDLEGTIKAHAWPLQKEEWQLNYWLDQNFEIFILGNHKQILSESPKGVMKGFHLEIENRCEFVRYFEPSKPLYYEYSATIYKCSK